MAQLSQTVITAANQWSTSHYLIGWFNVSVWRPGQTTLGGTIVTLQRSFDKGVTWLDVKLYTAPAEEYGFEPEGATYRIGVKGAQYIVTCTLRLGMEPGMTH